MIYIATSNPNKVKEFKAILPLVDFRLFDSKIEVEENGSTYIENALIKAKAYYDSLDVKVPVIADDSGIEIEAFDNKPGIHTSRFMESFKSREECLLYVVNNLKNNRKATFHCALVLIETDGTIYKVEGICKGNIATNLKGLGGFGYDPIFIPDGYDMTFADLGEDIKNKVSHRANAFKLLKEVHGGL